MTQLAKQICLLTEYNINTLILFVFHFCSCAIGLHFKISKYHVNKTT